MAVTSIEARAQALAEDFDLLDGWEDRIAHVIDLGRKAPALAEAERSEANKVRGCASQVWIVRDPSALVREGLAFRGQSDAAIVQGLVTILTGLFSDATPEDILRTDAAALLERLGLAGALTAQRANGLASMVKRIRHEAAMAVRPVSDSA
jgi:cysteine desulfuration protein SufE